MSSNFHSIASCLVSRFIFICLKNFILQSNTQLLVKFSSKSLTKICETIWASKPESIESQLFKELRISKVASLRGLLHKTKVYNLSQWATKAATRIHIKNKQKKKARIVNLKIDHLTPKMHQATFLVILKFNRMLSKKQ
jgi:hypothetical protein